jgi:zinc-ribbon domain
MTTPAALHAACPSCHAALSDGARYCHRCGRAVNAGSGERAIWIVAWSTVAIFIVLIVYFVNRAPTAATGPDMANAGNSRGGPAGPGAPPDISQMTPRERFLRLHDRVMSAAQSGDSATVQRFSPMAIAAYGMLDKVDVDLRYHAGSLYIQTGGYKEALALADTIQAEAKGNLLGTMLRLEVAQARRDAAATARYSKAFLDNYDRQLALKRPEYEEHKAMLEELRKQLQAN